MTMYSTNPLQDPRWEELLALDPAASVFHSRGWLEALRRTYGYEPVVFSTSAPDESLTNGIVFCKVKSWLTGSRLVSLPFSDHCQPLGEIGELRQLFMELQEARGREGWKYVELRPRTALESDGSNMIPDYAISEQFYLHALDLQPTLDSVYSGFHKSCIQRKIQRGEREGLVCVKGCSDGQLQKFYSLLVLTRRRHQLPPQPFQWFKNLRDYLGDRLNIFVAEKDGKPVASILTLQFKKALVYKYGSSDAEQHHLGGMPFLFWQAIQEAKANGLEEYDLGRSETNNAGLVTYKDHWGAACALLTYFRYPVPTEAKTSEANWGMRAARFGLSRLPDSLLAASGKLFYKHVA